MKALTQDDVRDIAIKIVGEMVENHIIKDCTDTDDETEFDVQDIIVTHLSNMAVDIKMSDEEFYLMFWNDYLTIEKIAEDYGVSVEYATEKVSNGRRDFNLKS
tara:strand:+ start:48 stop:356 length:309 start_codon:yes stop_codon:yes gene_type:complete